MILVANLASNATEDSVRALFSPYGEVVHVGIIRHPQTGRPGGACFVDMSSGREEQRAIAALDGQVFEGNRIGVLVAPASAVLLPFGMSLVAPDTGEQPPAREAAEEMLKSTETAIAFSMGFLIRYVLMLAAGMVVCSLFLPGMPLQALLFPFGLIPMAITGLLFIWVFIVAVGMIVMRLQHTDQKRLVDDLTTRDRSACI